MSLILIHHVCGLTMRESTVSCARVSLFAVPAAMLLAAGSFAFAADEIPGKRCLLDVRSLKGTAPAEENTTKELEAGEFVADLHDQLEALPYKHFETLGHEQQQVPVHEKGAFRVPSANGSQNSVFVEVECVTEVGASLKIDWNNESGQNLVSTQVRLLDGKNWVLGTDHEDSSATIVSVKVDCHPEIEEKAK